MSVNCRQAESLSRFRTLPAALCLLFAGSFALAGETAVEPSGNGVDLLQDTTFDEDSRSSETSAAAEDLVEAVPAHPHDVPLADAVTVAMADRLSTLAADLASKAGTVIPEDRLAQEAAMLATKADVREELDRLHAHILSARTLLGSGQPAGRKLDFLAQEFMREANTLCSKAGSMELTNIGLALKSAVDQFKEQVANVE